MHRLEKLILEQYASIQERKKVDELPKEFVAAIEKRYGKMHPKDFFSNDDRRLLRICFYSENRRNRSGFLRSVFSFFGQGAKKIPRRLDAFSVIHW